jgi:hypothetical protein
MSYALNRPNALHLHFKGGTRVQISGFKEEYGDLVYYDFCDFIDRLEAMKEEIRETYFPHLDESSVRPSCESPESPESSNWEPTPNE